MFTKSHRKWFTGLAILLVLVLVAVACGDSATSTPQPVAATAIPQPVDAIPEPVDATAIPEPVDATAIPEPVAATAIPEPVVAPTVTAKRFEGETMVFGAFAGPFMDATRDLMGKKFEEETGGKISFVPVYDAYVDLIASAPENRPPYDAVTCFGPDIFRGLAEDLWLPLRLENIPNALDLTEFHTRTSGSGFEGVDLTYLLPFEMYLLVIGYNKELLDFEPTSWADLWRPEVQGKIGLDTVYHFINTGAAALILDDQPGIDEMFNEEGLDVIIEKLQELDVALWWDTAAQGTAAMQRGDISILAHGAELMGVLVNESPEKYAHFVPKEGSPGGVDYLCSIRGTQHREMVEVFFNYMLDPELQGQWAEFIPYWMSNSKTQYGPIASQLIPPTYEERIATFYNMDWPTYLDRWDHIDERLRKEVYTK